MVTRVGSITAERATKALRRLVARHGADRDGLRKVAALLGVTERIVGNQYEKAQRGETISGEILGRTVCWVEKQQMFDLEIYDPRLGQHGSLLLENFLAEMREELEQNHRERVEALDAREADLSRREEDLSKDLERSQADMQQREKWIERRRREVIEREVQVEERETEVEARVAEVRSQAAAVKRREERVSEPEVIRRSLAPGGPLAQEPGKSLDRARTEFYERYWRDQGGRPDLARDARTRRIALEQKERTFYIMSAPLRVIIYAIVSLELTKGS